MASRDIGDVETFIKYSDIQHTRATVVNPGPRASRVDPALLATSVSDVKPDVARLAAAILKRVDPPFDFKDHVKDTFDRSNATVPITLNFSLRGSSSRFNIMAKDQPNDPVSVIKTGQAIRQALIAEDPRIGPGVSKARIISAEIVSLNNTFPIDLAVEFKRIRPASVAAPVITEMDRRVDAIASALRNRNVPLVFYKSPIDLEDTTFREIASLDQMAVEGEMRPSPTKDDNIVLLPQGTQENPATLYSFMFRDQESLSRLLATSTGFEPEVYSMTPLRDPSGSIMKFVSAPRAVAQAAMSMLFDDTQKNTSQMVIDEGFEMRVSRADGKNWNDTDGVEGIHLAEKSWADVQHSMQATVKLLLLVPI